MKRKFVCNTYNGYSIRNYYFTPNPTGRGCTLETEDPMVIELIENADGYGVFIHPFETPEEIALMKAEEKEKEEAPTEEKPVEPPEETETEEPEEDEPEPPAHQGMRGTHGMQKRRKK